VDDGFAKKMVRWFSLVSLESVSNHFSNTKLSIFHKRSVFWDQLKKSIFVMCPNSLLSSLYQIHPFTINHLCLFIYNDENQKSPLNLKTFY
jgi:hypothetical protein